MAKTVSFETEDRLRLEGILSLPEQAPVGGVVLCHPHPGLGGTMQAPLVVRLFRRLTASSRPVLRFNFRGVGGSEGQQTGGSEEVKDVAAAVRFIRTRLGLPKPSLVGWSFGAVMAVRYAEGDPDLAGLVAIAPPVAVEGFDVGDPKVAVPLLWIAGDKDPYCPVGSLDDLPGAKAIVGGANHFFWAREERLVEAVLSFLSKPVHQPDRFA